MNNKEREIINSHLRSAYNMLRLNGDIKHAYELETVIKSIESDIWSSERWPDEKIGELPSFEEHLEYVRQSVNSGAM